MLVGDGASACVARPSGRAKSSAAAYGQMQRAPFSSKSVSCRPGAGCVAEDVCGHAPEPRGIERVAECTFFGGRLAVVVSVSRQWRNVQDFPQMQHERSTQLVLFGSASRKASPRFWRVDGHSRGSLLSLTSQAGKVETAGARGFDEVACEQQHCWRRTA